MNALQQPYVNNILMRGAVLRLFILVCGIDATVEALNALKDGTLSMTVFQNGYEQGYQGIVAALDILNGKTVEKFIEVPYETVLPEQADEYLEIVGG